MDPSAAVSPAARRNIKARPVGLSAWKQQFLQQCEERVKQRRHELIDSIRKRSMTASDLMHDLVAIEEARARDGSPGGSPFTLRRVAEGGKTDEENDDDGDLTAEERVEFLLYLQATLYKQADEEEACELMRLEAEERAEVAARVEWADGGGGDETSLRPDEVAELLSPEGRRSPALSCTTPTKLPHAPGAYAAAAMIDDGAAAAASPVLPSSLHVEHSDVLCPLCRKRCLFVVEQVVVCRCGLRLNTANGLTLSHLQRSLAETYAAHRRGGCSAEPLYEVRDYFGIDALWMLCAHCDDLQVVL